MKERQGKVVKSTGSRYRVSDGEGVIHDCSIRGSFRMKGSRTTNPVAVGDDVIFFPSRGEEPGVITRILKRRNYIIRRSPNLARESQVLASNIDQVIIMVSMVAPETPVEFIDRVLVTAEAYRVPVLILFNKTDLYNSEVKQKVKELRTLYENIGYNVHESSITVSGVDEKLRELILNRTTLLTGNSGVGKSTLINLLNPDLRIKTAEISDYHLQGKHTTTFPEMHPVKGGGFIIDSPGIRGFGVIDMDKKEIYHFFPEIFKRSKECRFNNCLHLEEPGCAVRKAVEDGEIEWLRYRSYLSIMEDGDHRYR